MSITEIYIRKYGWTLTVLFDVDHRCTGDVIDYLDDIRVGDDIVDRAYNLVTKSDLDYGFTASNKRLRESVVVIGTHSSESEFLNTVQHEIRHVVDDISDVFGLSKHGEEVGYLTGNINSFMTKDIQKHICSCKTE